MAGTVKIDLRNFDDFRRRVGAVGTGGGGAFNDVLLQWSVRYRSFAQRRFSRFARGQGDWPPLARSTLIARARASLTRANTFNRRYGTRAAEDRARQRGRVSRGRAALRRGQEAIDGGTFNASILIDRGIVWAALSPAFVGGPGQFQQMILNGIRVGYGGPGRHDGGPATVAEIARFHDSGAGRLPRREIIVMPDPATIRGMEDDLARALKRM